MTQRYVVRATPSTVTVAYDDDVRLRLGSDDDIAAVLRSTILATNTALTNVLIGTPVTPAVAANSLILSNITASGDVLIAANRGGNSEAYIWIDASAGQLKLYGPNADIVAARHITFDTGVAVTAANYSSGRDADATNQYHINVPTGAGLEVSVNDVAAMTLSATRLLIPVSQGNILIGAAEAYTQAYAIRITGTIGPSAGGFGGEIGIDIAPTLTLGVASVGYGLYVRPTFTEAASGVHSLLAGIAILAATVTAGAATLTDTASLYISGAMAATVTGDNYAVWVDAGVSRFDDSVLVGLTTHANVNGTAVGLFAGGLSFTDVANAWIDDATHGTGTVVHYIGNNTINVTAPSDERLKDIVGPTHLEAMPLLRQVQMIDFSFKGEQEIRFGWGARQVYSVIPEVVLADGDWRVPENRLVPYLVKAAQELDARLIALERRA